MASDAVIAKGTCYPLFAYEVAQSIDLDAAERRMVPVTARQTVKHKRRAPAYFEYRPAPVRVTLDAPVHEVGGHRTLPSVELVLYDFGAVSVSYAIPIDGALSALPALSYELWGNARLLEDSRRHVERLMATLGAVAVRPRIASFVEDYAIFHIEAFATPCDAAALVAEHAATVAQILRAEPHPLSQQEVTDATASRLSFGPSDAAFVDTDATVLFDPEGDDVRAVIEFANTQLLEMRYLDQQLDDALDRSYEMLTGRRWTLRRRYRPDLQQLAELHMDGALLFERVTNALKLVDLRPGVAAVPAGGMGRGHHPQAAGDRQHLREDGRPGSGTPHGAARVDHHRPDRILHRSVVPLGHTPLSPGGPRAPRASPAPESRLKQSSDTGSAPLQARPRAPSRARTPAARAAMWAAGRAGVR